jgi:DNA-binding NarL/FixJ family response regulator
VSPQADKTVEGLVWDEVAAVSTMIVDDSEDMRSLLRLLIELEPGLELVAEATDAGEAIALWRVHRPRVVVLDYRLPDTNGLDVAEAILAEDPDAAILLFSAFLDDGAIERAERLGVRECVSKDEVRRVPQLALSYGA